MALNKLVGLTLCIMISMKVTDQKSVTKVTKDPPTGSQDVPQDVETLEEAELTQDVTQRLGVGKKVFKTVDLPKHFASYDVLKRDGLVSLEELIKVTGAEKNIKGVFDASDIDDDGFLNPAEFSDAPWFLGNIDDVDEDTIELPVVLEEIEEDLTSMDNSKKDIYSKPIMETVDEYIEEEKEEEEKVINELKRRKYHVFSKYDTDIW